MTGYIYESSYDTNSKLGKDIEHLKSDFDEIGVKLLLECEKSYTLLEACKRAENLIRTARKYFPKSVKNSDKFDLENTCATLGKAIHNAE